MKQIGRRLAYLAFGVAPTCYVFPLAVAFGGLVLAGAALGLVGLVAATWQHQPVSRRIYGRTALLLVAGIAAMLPFSLIIIYGTLADFVTASTGTTLATAVRDVVTRLWGFGGPLICAVHYLWRAGCAPNNSFKPKPLRGSA